MIAAQEMPKSSRTVKELSLTEYSRAANPVPIEQSSLDWPSTVERFQQREIREEKDGKAFSFVALKPGTTRRNENVTHLSAIVMDIDDGTPIDSLRSSLAAYEYIAVSSHSHSLGKPKYRLIMPLSRDVSSSEWPVVWRRANALIGQHGDSAAKDLCRLYYFPSCPAAGFSEAFFRHNEGSWLDPDSLPAALPIIGSKGTETFEINAGAAGGIEASPDESRVCRDGERTQHLVSLIGRWLNEGSGLDDLTEKALEWNSKNVPPQTDEKVKDTCKSMWNSYASERPAVAPISAPSTALPVGPYLTTSGSNVFSHSVWPATPPTRLFDLVEASVGPFLLEQPPRRRYLLKDCLPLGKVGAIIASGGTGKSHFVLQLAISVATGLPLAQGAWQVGESGGVLALFAEDDREELHRRIHSSVNKLVHETKEANLVATLQRNLFVRSMVAENNLMTHVEPIHNSIHRSDYCERLVATARDVPDLKLIIVDPASRFRGGNENAAEDMTRFVEALEFVCKETAATVLVVHHANKASMQGTEQTQGAARGSSAFTDGIRWQMNLSGMTKDEAKTYGIADDQRSRYLSATITKNNYGPPQPPVFLRRLDGGVLAAAELQASAKGNRDGILLQITGKVAAENGQRSARRFEEEFGGQENIFGIGKLKLRGFINQALDMGYLTKDEQQKLCVTKSSAAALTVMAKPKSAISG